MHTSHTQLLTSNIAKAARAVEQRGDDDSSEEYLAMANLLQHVRRLHESLLIEEGRSQWAYPPPDPASNQWSRFYIGMTAIGDAARTAWHRGDDDHTEEYRATAKLIRLIDRMMQQSREHWRSLPPNLSNVRWGHLGR